MQVGRLSFYLSQVTVLALLFSASACTSVGNPSVGAGLKGDLSKLPSKLLLLPVDISIREYSAAGMTQEDPIWSKQGEEAMSLAIKAFFDNGGPAELLEMPVLTEAETELVHQHSLLYDTVAGEAFTAVNRPNMGWGHLARDFHYTLGNGLRFLKQKTGAEAALIVLGRDSISTKGRKSMVIMAAVMGFGLPLGNTQILVGVVDLEHGDILWFRNIVSQEKHDLRNSRYAKILFNKAMEGYGGK